MTKSVYDLPDDVVPAAAVAIVARAEIARLRAELAAAAERERCLRTAVAQVVTAVDAAGAPTHDGDTDDDYGCGAPLSLPQRIAALAVRCTGAEARFGEVAALNDARARLTRATAAAEALRTLVAAHRSCLWHDAEQRIVTKVEMDDYAERIDDVLRALAGESGEGGG